MSAIKQTPKGSPIAGREDDDLRDALVVWGDVWHPPVGPVSIIGNSGRLAGLSSYMDVLLSTLGSKSTAN